MSRPDDSINLDWELMGLPAAQQCEALLEDIVRYSQSPGGKWLTPDQVKDIKHAIKQIERRLMESRPHRKCPFWSNCKRGCKLCNGVGFLPHRMSGVITDGGNHAI